MGTSHAHATERRGEGCEVRSARWGEKAVRLKAAVPVLRPYKEIIFQNKIIFLIVFYIVQKKTPQNWVKFPHFVGRCFSWSAGTQARGHTQIHFQKQDGPGRSKEVVNSETSKKRREGQTHLPKMYPLTQSVS